MAALITSHSISERIHLLKALEASLETNNPIQIQQAFDRVERADRATLEALKGCIQPIMCGHSPSTVELLVVRTVLNFMALATPSPSISSLRNRVSYLGAFDRTTHASLLSVLPDADPAPIFSTLATPSHLSRGFLGVSEGSKHLKSSSTTSLPDAASSSMTTTTVSPHNVDPTPTFSTLATPSHLSRGSLGVYEGSKHLRSSSTTSLPGAASSSTTPATVSPPMSSSSLGSYEQSKRYRPSSPPCLPYAPLPHIARWTSPFLNQVINWLNLRDLRSFSCVQQGLSRTIHSIKQAQPLDFRIKYAIRNDDVEELRTLLYTLPPEQRKAAINAGRTAKTIPLFICIREGSLKCLELLVNEGADLTVTTSLLKNVLHYAAEQAKPDILKYLLPLIVSTEKLEILLDDPDSQKRTPLLSCGLSGSMECLRLLLKAGANILDQSRQGNNLLHIALDSQQFLFVRQCLESLPASHCHMLANLQNKIGNLPLCHVMTADCTNEEAQTIFTLLLKCGTNPLHTNNKRHNFVHLALIYSCPDLLRLLMEYVSPEDQKALANMRDYEGNSPVILAVHYRQMPCLKLLIQAGGDLFTSNHMHHTISSYCVELPNRDLWQFLLKHEPKLEGLPALKLFTLLFGEQDMIVEATGETIAFQGASPKFIRNEMLKFLNTTRVKEQIIAICSEIDFNELVNAYANCILKNEDTIVQILDRIRSGRLTILQRGWKDHSICYVWYSGYLVICNRGEGALTNSKHEGITLFARKIDLTCVDRDLILKLKHLQTTKVKTAAKFVYTTLPTLLKGVEDPFCQSLAAINPKFSKADVCAYASPKAALRASLALLTRNPELAKRLSKTLSIMHREDVLTYFERTPSPFSHESRQALLAKGKMSIQQRRLKLGTASRESSTSSPLP